MSWGSLQLTNLVGGALYGEAMREALTLALIARDPTAGVKLLRQPRRSPNGA